MSIVEAIKDIDILRKIIETLKKQDFKCAVCFMIGLYSGLRISDILNLKIKDVEKDTISIIEQKTGKRKDFPIKKELKLILDKQLKIRYSDEATCNDFLIIGSRGGKLDRSIVYRAINNVCKKYIDGNFGTHTMRKTFGYHHYQQNHDVALLQKIFNHSAPTITLRYIGIAQDEINKSYNNFSYRYKNKKFSVEEELQKINQRLDKLISLVLDVKLV